MKKLLVLAVALLIVGVTGASVMAQQVGAQNAVRARIRTMGALGNGLAISQSDSMDFEFIKVGIAGVKVGLTDEAAEVKVGILYFGEDKYKLKDIVIGNGSVTANIYDNDGNQTGTISLDSYPKGDKEVWAGTLALNGANYNAYVLQASRVVKAAEKAEKSFEYCKNNPENCKAAMKAVGQIVCDPVTDGNCSGRIRTFCEQNPEDSRCKRLKFEYCKENLEDSDCRAEIMGVCRNNATENACERLGEVYNKFVEKKPEVLKNAPRWFLTVRERIRENVQQQTGEPGTGQQQQGQGGQ